MDMPHLFIHLSIDKHLGSFYLFFKSSPKDMLIDFRERGREGERERNIDVREKYCLVASLYAPTGDQTCDLLVYGSDTPNK